MQKLKQYWAIILLLFLIIVGAFYWYEWRPSQIRKNCYKTAVEKAISLLKTKAELSVSYKEVAERDMYLKDDYNSAYNTCLQLKGITR